MILALDCATKTGWCLWDNGKIIESGVQDFAKQRGESNGAMFLRFRHWLKSMIIGFGFKGIVAPSDLERLRYGDGLVVKVSNDEELVPFPMNKISFVIYEQAHHRGGAATEISVNLTGRVQEICAELGIEFASVHTGTLKKFATGRGNTDKSEVMAKAREILGREPLDDNEADAVMLAKYASENYG